LYLKVFWQKNKFSSTIYLGAILDNFIAMRGAGMRARCAAIFAVKARWIASLQAHNEKSNQCKTIRRNPIKFPKLLI